MDRLRCLGNAIVPQVAEVIGRAIIAFEEERDMDGRRKWDMRAVRAREARVEHPFWRVVDDVGRVMMLGLTLAQANEMVRTRVGAARVVRDPNWREPRSALDAPYPLYIPLTPDEPPFKPTG